MPDPKTMPLGGYPMRTTEQLRYGDTDRQGHINNAAFAAFFENNRTALLLDPDAPFIDAADQIVIAKLAIEFVAELHWPGAVVVGVGVARLGRSSFDLQQTIYDGDRVVACAHSVLVHIDGANRRGKPLPDEARRKLEALSLDAGAAEPG